MPCPAVVSSLMAEPTETEAKETIDRAIAVFRKLYEKASENPEALYEAPKTAAVARLDEVEAARHPVVKYAHPGVL